MDCVLYSPVVVNQNMLKVLSIVTELFKILAILNLNNFECDCVKITCLGFLKLVKCSIKL